MDIEVTIETAPEIEVEILPSGPEVQVEVIASGPQGPPGPGVPPAGQPGQVIIKNGTGDYESTWGSLEAADDGAGNVTVFFEVS